MKKGVALLSLLLVSACASNKEENVAKPVNKLNQAQIEKKEEQKIGKKDAVKEFNRFASSNPVYFEFDSVDMQMLYLMERGNLRNIAKTLKKTNRQTEKLL